MKIPLVFAMKIWWIGHENLVNFPWINSQDFHGFLFSSARGFLCWENRTPRLVLELRYSYSQKLKNCDVLYDSSKEEDWPKTEWSWDFNQKIKTEGVNSQSVNRRVAVIKPVVLAMLRLLSISTLATATICRSSHVKMANNQANIAVYD